MILADVMDDAEEGLRRVPSLAGRSFGHPVDSIAPPAGIVPFPRVDYDQAKGRGLDRLDIDIVVLVSRVYDKAARDLIVGYLDGEGAESVKAALEGHTWTACDLAHVRQAGVQPYTMADVSYWAAVFLTQFVGSGTTS